MDKLKQIHDAECEDDDEDTEMTNEEGEDEEDEEDEGEEGEEGEGDDEDEVYCLQWVINSSIANNIFLDPYFFKL